MKDLSEAMLIDMETRARTLVDLLEEDPESMRVILLIDKYNEAFDQAQAVAQDLSELLEHVRAFSIEAQKAENAA